MITLTRVFVNINIIEMYSFMFKRVFKIMLKKLNKIIK